MCYEKHAIVSNKGSFEEAKILKILVFRARAGDSFNADRIIPHASGLTGLPIEFLNITHFVVFFLGFISCIFIPVV